MTAALARRLPRLPRLLLRAYPRAFHERFGDEFVAFAETRLGEARPTMLGTLRCWAALVADVARSAPAAHRHALGTRRRAAPSAPREDVMDTLRHDLRFALRALARRPGFAAVVALALALGIGANAAIFSVVDAVLRQTLPWPHADRLVDVRGAASDGAPGLSYPDFLALRDGVRAFDEIGVARPQSVNLTGVERPDRLAAAFGGVAALLALVGAGACWLPARRAARTDPRVTLGAE